MNSFLINGGNSDERLKKSLSLLNSHFSTYFSRLASHPDLLILEPDLSIGIKQIRQAQKFLSRRPYQEKIKAVIIPEAEKITIPAQNAFLKTLEEPPAHSQIILCAPQKEDLLPTIISRCQIIHLKSKSTTIGDQEMTVHCSLIADILAASPGQRLQLIEPYTRNREEAIAFCQRTILALRSQIKNKKDKNLSIFNHLSLLTSAMTLLHANINVKLVLENLALDL
jgi:hypothetical protein